MARTSLEDVLSLGDPAQAWNFDLFFPSIPGMADTRSLTYRVKTTDMPGTQLEPLEVALHGVVVPYAGRRMFTQTLNVTLHETADWGTRDIFTNWIELARSWRQNSGSYFNTYAVPCLLVTYDDIPQPIKTWQINYIWPENLQETSLDGSTSGPVEISVSFKYTDWFLVQ
ncbi:tail tube protein [Achromobacter phage Motura]|uniref:Tail tube protein n=1 Tax=Achromobacter phage Motura TaxID=2591403 RepID=A0A514CSZ1_9CAUD|nr:tail tube protein [Achromobacter phage Motura]QDH83592.1 tail tube protein [Achromobacter phage Motura]